MKPQDFLAAARRQMDAHGVPWEGPIVAVMRNLAMVVSEGEQGGEEPPPPPAPSAPHSFFFRRAKP